MAKAKELLEKRALVWEAMRTLNDKAKDEKREFSAEEKDAYEKAEKDFDALTDEIKAEEKREKDVAEFEFRHQARASAMSEPRQSSFSIDPGNSLEDKFTDLPSKENRYHEAVAGYREQSKGVVATKEYRQLFNRYLVGGLNGAHCILTDIEKRQLEECRALQADSDTVGGYLVVPEQFVNSLIMAVDNLTFIRRYATVIAVPNAASLGAPSLDADPADPTWTSEILTGSEDSTMRFGKRELHPHPLARRIKISKKLIRVSRMNVDSIVRDRLAYKFAVVQENAFLNGSGANQPLGVFTASNSGIGTGRDISTGNTATAITADGLINAKYNQKAQYRGSSRWIFHRDAIKMIRKLKDGDGNYIWRPGLATDKPDTILDVPFDESEYAPSTFTTGLYVGLLADWRFYWVADALNMNIQVLTELYAETNQNGYIGRLECDGAPVLGEAFTRIKLG